MAIVEYGPVLRSFPGVIGRTADESSPAWPAPVRAREGAPNVLFIVLDDTGFGQLGCYGSPIETPSFDALAANGLRYNNMHTTALCSPSRSCILTGRNHHSNAMAAITELASGYPGYNGVVPFENGFLSEMLLEHGYSTFMVGKYHLTPSNQETGAGPFDRWPLGRGFQRFYGFLGGDTSQWYPDLVYDNHQVEPPRTPEEGYHLSEDLVDKAIEFIADVKQVDPAKPFYLHLCFGATHAPHHVPKEWADRYAGQFDEGWDAYREKVFARQKELGIVPADAELSRHDPDVPDWASLPPAARRLYSRYMEVFAGFLSHADHQVGRLVEFLRMLGELDNTLIMVISDNGASAEGGPTGTTNEAQFFNNAQEPLEESLKLIDEIGGPKHFNHYPWGWTWAGNTPFRRWKRETYRGGASDPFIVSWPRRITARGEVRTQYAHIIDMVPTVLDLLGLDPPATIRGVTQSPLHGVSFARTLDDAAAETSHHTQYFEMLGHRAIYHDGWRAVCPWPGPSFTEAGMGFGQPISAQTLSELDATAGSCTTWRRTSPRTTTWPPTPRPADRDDRDLVRGGRQVQRDAGRRQRPGPHDRREAARRGPPRPLHLPARHAIDPVLRRPQGPEPPAQHHRGRRDPRGRGRGGAAVPGHVRRRILLVRQGRQAPLRPQLRRPGHLRSGIRRRSSSQASTRSGSNSNPPDSRTCPTARARPGGSSSTSTVPSPGTRKLPSPTRSCSIPVRSPAAPTPARRSPTTTPARSSSPAPSTA